VNRYDFYFEQLVTEGQMDQAFEWAEEADWLIRQTAILGREVSGDARGAIHTGCNVTENAAPDLNVIVESGTCTDPTGRHVSWSSDQLIDCSVDYLAASTAVVGVGNQKYLGLFALWNRSLTDPVSDGNGLTVYFQQFDSYEIRVVQGTEAVSPSLVNTPSDAIRLANILLGYGTTQILNADITFDDAGYLRDDYVRTNGVNIPNFVYGNPSDALAKLAADVDTYSSGGSVVFSGTEDWHDGSGPLSSAAVSPAINEIVADLAEDNAGAGGEWGSDKIGSDGNPSTYGHINLSRGSIWDQLLELQTATDDAIEDMANLTVDETVTGKWTFEDLATFNVTGVGASNEVAIRATGKGTSAALEAKGDTTASSSMGGHGIKAWGGTGSGGYAGDGVIAYGADGVAHDAGEGVVAYGGAATSPGRNGIGVRAYGGAGGGGVSGGGEGVYSTGSDGAGSDYGGNGVYAEGGDAENGPAGLGVLAYGGAASGTGSGTAGVRGVGGGSPSGSVGAAGVEGEGADGAGSDAGAAGVEGTGGAAVNGKGGAGVLGTGGATSGTGDGGDGVKGQGGTGVNDAGGRGLYAGGGDTSGDGIGGAGVYAAGGDANNSSAPANDGGDGVRAVGGHTAGYGTPGVGVYGEGGTADRTTGGTGVKGVGADAASAQDGGPGVRGEGGQGSVGAYVGGAGVEGVGGDDDGTGVHGTGKGAGDGVYGTNGAASGGNGVKGQTGALGTAGVYGLSVTGVGVKAEATSGCALQIVAVDADPAGGASVLGGLIVTTSSHPSGVGKLRIYNGTSWVTVGTQT